LLLDDSLLACAEIDRDDALNGLLAGNADYIACLRIEGATAHASEIELFEGSALPQEWAAASGCGHYLDTIARTRKHVHENGLTLIGDRLRASENTQKVVRMSGEGDLSTSDGVDQPDAV
jgi:hypothetical protein